MKQLQEPVQALKKFMIEGLSPRSMRLRLGVDAVNLGAMMTRIAWMYEVVSTLIQTLDCIRTR